MTVLPGLTLPTGKLESARGGARYPNYIAMHSPFKKTLDVLATSPCPTAVETLLHALSSLNSNLRDGAVSALLRRRSARGIQEIIRRFDSFGSDVRASLERHLAALSSAFKHCLQHGDDELRRNALEMIRTFEDYSQFGVLVTLLEIPEFPLRDRVLLVIRELADRLYEHLKFGREMQAEAELAKRAEETRRVRGTARTEVPEVRAEPIATPPKRFLRDADRIRLQTVAVLEQACRNYSKYEAPELVECLLILSDIENTHAQRTIREAPEACRQLVTEILRTSTHPAIVMLVYNGLALNYPFPGTVAAFEQRTDAEFIAHFLRAWPRKLTVFQHKNLKQVQRLAWINPEELNLEIVPPNLHRTLISLVLTTGLPEDHKLSVLEWMVKHGSADGRHAAADVLVDIKDNKVQEVVLESLDSDDAEVQAWATSQLRTRDIPQAFGKLIQRLDSPMAEVQEAARRELGDFDLQRALLIYEQLDPHVCLAVGRLICKIDPHTISKLQHELTVAIRRRRIRAARAARALGLQEQVADALVLMSQDADALVRRSAAEILGDVSPAAAARSLTALLEDPSPRVRDAAKIAMQRQQLLFGHDSAESHNNLEFTQSVLTDLI